MTTHDTQNPYDSTSHPTDEQLISYVGGNLPAPAQERVQAHLVDCDQCLELLKDVEHFFESPRQDEELIGEERLHAWAELWKRIQVADRSSVVVLPAKSRINSR